MGDPRNVAMAFNTHRYGGFLKWGYLQVIYFDRSFHYKPSISGIPPFMETTIYIYIWVNYNDLTATSLES